VEFFLLQKGTGISFFENTLPLFFLCCPPGTRGGKNEKKQGVCHTVALPFTLKSILM
jgi:hypothetical protein